MKKRRFFQIGVGITVNQSMPTDSPTPPPSVPLIEVQNLSFYHEKWYQSKGRYGCMKETVEDMKQVLELFYSTYNALNPNHSIKIEDCYRAIQDLLSVTPCKLTLYDVNKIPQWIKDYAIEYQDKARYQRTEAFDALHEKEKLLHGKAFESRDHCYICLNHIFNSDIIKFINPSNPESHENNSK